MSRFYKRIWFYICIVPAFAFAFTLNAPSTVVVSETRQFDWTWSPNDSHKVGVALKMISEDGKDCPQDTKVFFGPSMGDGLDVVQYDLNVGAQNQDTDGPQSGSSNFVIRQTGKFVLCAYKYPDSMSRRYDSGGRNQDHSFTLIANSTFITAVLATTEGLKLSAGGIAGLTIGCTAFLVLLIFGTLFYRRIRYHQRLANFHRERMFLPQTPSPFRTPHSEIQSQIVQREQRVTMTTDTTSLAPLIQSPKRPHSHRRSVPLGYDDSMMKTYHFPPRDGASTSSETASLPSVVLPIDPEKAITRS